MKWWLRMAMVLAGGGRATTAAGFAPSERPPNSPAEAVSAEASAEVAAAPPDQPDILVTATSPTDIQFSANARDVVVRAPAAPLTHLRRREVVHQSMIFGAAIGAVAGLVSGAASDRQQSTMPECDTIGCGGNAIIGGIVFGAIGLGLGAAVGAIVGRLAYP